MPDLTAGPAQPHDEGFFVAHVATEGEVKGDSQPIALNGVQLALSGPTIVVVSSAQHNAFMGEALPIGQAELRRVGNEIVALGAIWLETLGGSEAWKVLRRRGASQKWSIGYQTLAKRRPTEEERGRGVAEWHAKILPYEISMVAAPANSTTSTRILKCRADLEEEFEWIRRRQKVHEWALKLKLTRARVV